LIQINEAAEPIRLLLVYYDNQAKEGFAMLTKTTLALATALALGIASVALAANDDQPGGFRELGPGGAATQGVNPAFHKAAAAKCAKLYKKSYDPSDMTFLGKDGKRHPCPG
jgi:BA14K-like protein